MSRRTQIIAQNVSAAITNAQAPLALVAEAAHLPEEELNARLHGVTAFTVPELVEVGGFLRLRASQFLEGVPA